MSDDPIGTYEALANREYLERATTELKASPLFHSFSRRLLFDLVERSGLHVLPPASGIPTDYIDEESPRDPVRPGPFLAIVVLEGPVIARPKPPAPKADDGVALQPGVHLRSDAALRFPLGQLRLSASKDRGAIFVAISPWALADFPTAAWSINLNALPGITTPFREPAQDLVPALTRARRTELIWVSISADAGVPLEAAMHIVGAAVAREISGAPVILYILGAEPQCLDWDGSRFVLRQKPPGPDFFLDQQGKRDRVFFGHPPDPLHPPQYVDFTFDRVAHLTKQMPSVLPEEVGKILRPSLCDRGEESIFSSFIASVLCVYDPKPPLGGLLCGTGEFKAQPLPTGAAGEPAMRPYRDSCVLRVDVPRLQRAWQTWIQGGPEQFPPFIDVADRERAVRKETNGRWARAVTNRRVGFALSGGGASAYRAGPLLSRIEAKKIPIDVFAALSGGALVGAFCCGAEPGGFNFVKWLGPFFQLTMPGVLVWTRPFETVVDACLGGTRVEDLEMRFAAVAVALPDKQVPQATVVVKGTLGEAVRVSGCLPPSFAPTTKNGIRYTDGGAGCLVPARAARDCGADVVLACNAIPGPALGNPYSALPSPAWLLRWTPFVGRLVDSYTWYAFSLCQSSREFGNTAEVFVEFKPQPFPLFESSAFIAAQCIVKEAEKEHVMLDEKVEQLRKARCDLCPPAPPTPPAPPARPAPASGDKRTRAKRKRRK